MGHCKYLCIDILTTYLTCNDISDTLCQIFQEFWWAVLLMGITFVIFMAIFIRCCAIHTPSSNPNLPKNLQFSETLRRPVRSLQKQVYVLGKQDWPLWILPTMSWAAVLEHKRGHVYLYIWRICWELSICDQRKGGITITELPLFLPRGKLTRMIFY